jgi:CPA1 family monovalent cation:H+ antiporter
MEGTFVILFSIASLVAVAARRIRVPYTIALVIVGLVVGAFRIVAAPHLTRELLFAVFLPGLIFEAAYNIHATELKESWRTVAVLAGPGVVISIACAAALITGAFRLFGLEPALSWQYVMVFAALVVATDPIAVVSMFRQMGVPTRLTTLVEAESLFNDGTSIVVLSLVLAYVDGSAPGVAGLTLQFLLVVGGGAIVGTALGYVLSGVSKLLDDTLVEITLTTIAAYGSFVAAEHLGLSGVVATVCAGLVLGTYGREVAMSERTRVSVDAFWEYIAFAMNSVVFLLIGFEVRPAVLLESAGPIVLAFLGVIVSRLVVVFGARRLLSGTSERIAPAWAAVLTWGGLRGALSMVLALALPPAFPHRDLLIDMTFGVVLLSLLVQGLTMQPLVKRLGAGLGT